jgi:uncharacterized membrane protein
MPYRYAHYFVLAIIPASVLAFWDSFFSRIAEASAAVHLHSWSATVWVLLLAAQSWAIHNKRRGLHAALGRVSLAVFPIFLASFLLVIRSEAQSVIAGNPFRTVFAPGIAVLTLVAFAAIAYLCYAALRNRHNVQLHARYMIAIPFMFTESVLGRVFNAYLPGLIVNSLEDIRNIYWSIHLSQALAIALAMFLYFQKPKFGKPYLIISVALVLQSLGLELFDDIGWWRALYLEYAAVPFAAPLTLGLIIGLLIVWRGWEDGKRRPKGFAVAS